MRQAMVNVNPDLAAANKRYVMRITGDEPEGKAQLDNFIDHLWTRRGVATSATLSWRQGTESTIRTKLEGCLIRVS